MCTLVLALGCKFLIYKPTAYIYRSVRRLVGCELVGSLLGLFRLLWHKDENFFTLSSISLWFLFYPRDFLYIYRRTGLRVGAEAKGRRREMRDEKNLEFVCVCTLIGFQFAIPFVEKKDPPYSLVEFPQDVRLFVQECELEWTHWKKRQCCFAACAKCKFYGVQQIWCVSEILRWKIRICMNLQAGRYGTN